MTSSILKVQIEIQRSILITDTGKLILFSLYKSIVINLRKTKIDFQNFKEKKTYFKTVFDRHFDMQLKNNRVKECY